MAPHPLNIRKYAKPHYTIEATCGTYNLNLVDSVYF